MALIPHCCYRTDGAFGLVELARVVPFDDNALPFTAYAAGATWPLRLRFTREGASGAWRLGDGDEPTNDLSAAADTEGAVGSANARAD
jgi:hypothetical protein